MMMVQQKKTLSPVFGERAVAVAALVVVVSLGGCRVVEVARGANVLAGERD